jgi:hypothetical protein
MDGQYKNHCPNCFKDGVKEGKCKYCGYSISEKNPVALRDFHILKGRYLIGKVLGAGGFGITYVAKDLPADKLCAIKEYLPEELAARDTETQLVRGSTPGNEKLFEHGLETFFNESKILGALADNKGIVKVTDYFLQNNTAYMVMEYLEGVTLQRLVTNNKNLIPYSTAYRLLLDVSAALEAVHRKGILHRDISPGNIFIVKEGQTKLIDFGAARYYMSGISRTLSIVLKPGYAPPEQYSSKGSQGPWTDIYALACTFYFVLSRTTAPTALDRLGGKTVEPLCSIDTNIPRELSLAIERAMELDINLRPQSITEFLYILQAGQGKGKANEPGAPAYGIRQPYPFRPSYGKGVGDNAVNIEAFGGKNVYKGAPAGFLSPRLEMTEGPMKGIGWALLPNVPIQIGRSKDNCEVVITEAEVISRIHCLLWYDEVQKCFYLQDCSRNGTYLGSGRMIENGKKEQLWPGDIFYLSTRNYSFRLVLRSNGEVI